MFTKNRNNAIEIELISKNKLNNYIKENPDQRRWIEQNTFTADPGELVIIPQDKDNIRKVLLGKTNENDVYSKFICSNLPKKLPGNNYYISNLDPDDILPYISWALGCYKYDSAPISTSKLFLPGKIHNEVSIHVESIFFTMDLINHPANRLTTEEFAKIIGEYFTNKNCKVTEIIGEDLLEHNFPLIYEVGKASSHKPRLVEIQWGKKNDPKVTLVGKGITFDTGGLDIKPSSGMLLMKKDMGGAANILGLANMIIGNKLNLNLRVLIPIAENSISSNSFRPGDILNSRSGLTVEIGNTDAEGRLILADSLTLADEGSPDLIIDMATLTGAARVAVGPEIVPFFSTSEVISNILKKVSQNVQDPVWELPFFAPYGKWLNNEISDLNNSPNTPFAGSIIAAEFLKKFITNTNNYLHFDVYSWNNGTNRYIPKGGAAQGIRAIYQLIKELYVNK
ncbi:MAG: leucyl aminopeptidase family protein [Pseudomonadota bacterium]|nr:leucyl aminopeptidase family protein [Pseudomonadota bacterium]MEC7671069.1 leucyl aminopeptidase family protein [Pseudomonadota bacterium]|tara:strand:- start:584 stop:1942 length:1359 start_codon:yes stop_codon:yes gene_type:complete